MIIIKTMGIWAKGGGCRLAHLFHSLINGINRVLIESG